MVPELILETDAVIALVGGTGGRPGVIVASGTGSVAFGIDSSGKRARSGGWGFILGDEGSGYDIARRGMIAALREYDGRGKRTVIRRRITEVLELKSTEDLIPLLYANPLSPGRVAALYPLILDAADDGDEVAGQLISDSAAALAEMGVATARKLDFGGEQVLVTTAGGVFRGQTLRDAFVAEIRRQLPEAHVIDPVQRAEDGAVMIAAARARGEKFFTDQSASGIAP
jgi:N-acetylglucosamine kinase